MTIRKVALNTAWIYLVSSLWVKLSGNFFLPPPTVKSAGLHHTGWYSWHGPGKHYLCLVLMDLLNSWVLTGVFQRVKVSAATNQNRSGERGWRGLFSGSMKLQSENQPELRAAANLQLSEFLNKFFIFIHVWVQFRVSLQKCVNLGKLDPIRIKHRAATSQIQTNIYIYI